MAKNENKEVVEEIQEQPKEQKEQAAIKTNEEVADAKINTPVEKEGGDMKMKAKLSTMIKFSKFSTKVKPR